MIVWVLLEALLLLALRSVKDMFRLAGLRWVLDGVTGPHGVSIGRRLMVCTIGSLLEPFPMLKLEVELVEAW